MNNESLKILQHDFAICRNYLRKVSQTMIEENITKFPVFAALPEEADLDVGVPVLRREELGTSYTFNASHLEDLANKEIIAADKRSVFVENYKDPAVYCCILMIDAESTGFVFIPYDQEVVWEPKNRELLN